MTERKIDMVTKEELTQAGCIYIPCLSEGLNQYSHLCRNRGNGVEQL